MKQNTTHRPSAGLSLGETGYVNFHGLQTGSQKKKEERKHVASREISQTTLSNDARKLIKTTTPSSTLDKPRGIFKQTRGYDCLCRPDDPFLI